MDKIEKAYEFAKIKHEGQTKPGDRPMMNHIDNILKTLKENYVDETTLCAAILHDTIEDSDVKLEKIGKEFGKEVAFLVDGLTKEDPRKDTEKIEEFARKDRRIIPIKIADLQDNLKNVKHFDEIKQRKVKRWFLIHIGLLSILVETETEKKMLENLIEELNKTY